MIKCYLNIIEVDEYFNIHDIYDLYNIYQNNKISIIHEIILNYSFNKNITYL